MIEVYKKHFAQILSQHIDLPSEEIVTMIEIPPENIPGDFAFPCFKLSKLLKKSPIQIAEDLEKSLQSKYFSSYKNISGYLNAYIDQKIFMEEIFQLSESPLQM
jgi:arginyl-tRNA synthetase